MTTTDDKIQPEDALKTIDKILVPDPRNKHIEVEEWHDLIAAITLTESTPKDVKQIFENAKNVALYSYYAYRLHQPAELIAYSALEKALRIKFDQEKEYIVSRRPPKILADYMDIAIERGWITDEGYQSSRPIARHRVQTRKIYKLISSGILDKGDPVPTPEPTESEVNIEMRQMEIARTRLHAGRHVRNFLAHGDTGLSPSSTSTLANIAEEINQIFK